MYTVLTRPQQRGRRYGVNSFDLVHTECTHRPEMSGRCPSRRGLHKPLPSTKGMQPSPRSGHSAVLWGQSLLVYGGMNGETNTTSNNLFEFRSDSMAWTALACKGAPPRNSHAAIVHKNKMVIIGGASPEGQTMDVFLIDLADRDNLQFHAVDCSAKKGDGCKEVGRDHVELPLPREMHTACLWPTLQEVEGASNKSPSVLMMGGRTAGGVEQSLFSLNLCSWEWCRLPDAPVKRCAHSACFLENTSIMAVFGGWDGDVTIAGDLFLYDARRREWSTVDISPVPIGRFAHAICAISDREIYVFGGVHPGEELAGVTFLRELHDVVH
ncbi:unnamed protein product [Choristocarpus tenellus]